MLIELMNKVLVFGYEVSDLGTHSIRKGATMYLSSQPGGPEPASTYI
jgi:hypothetical protein